MEIVFFIYSSSYRRSQWAKNGKNSTKINKCTSGYYTGIYYFVPRLQSPWKELQTNKKKTVDVSNWGKQRGFPKLQFLFIFLAHCCATWHLYLVTPGTISWFAQASQFQILCIQILETLPKP